MTNVELAIELIRKNVSMRSPQIEKELGINSAAATLQHKVDDGTLIMCKIERPGLRPCNEYRISMAGGGMSTHWRPLKTPKPINGKPPQIPRPGDDALARGADLGRKPPTESEAKQTPHAARLGSDAGAVTANRRADESNLAAPARCATPARASDPVPPAPISARIGPIEDGIPFPHSKRGTGELRLKISQLNVGQSFVTSYSDSACYNMARKLGMKVISRPEDGKAGKRNRRPGESIRVWRTE